MLTTALKTVALTFLLFSTAAQRAKECPSCAEWNTPQQPYRVFGNTYWVGPHGLGAILITSQQGHILIDGGLPESAPLIEASIRGLGFRVEDIKLILNSHAHYDHAGGIAALQRDSDAEVAASAWSARVLERGESQKGDPQLAIALRFPRARNVRVIKDGEVLHVGPLAVTAHFTPGHTPGGTTWTWRSCEGDRCLDIVYADSQTPVSADGFSFAPIANEFEHSESVIEQLPCDILLTPHPGASNLWERRAAGSFIDRDACRRFAAEAREQIAKRLATERQSK
ncbi:MAG TPA: subclass B3 metallo-beta-lactamase [Thermoanaerobaculia bacterium]|nr:subclass B3 metallo-beta-lactamase [Thermoanaerobaculia bacterium]